RAALGHVASGRLRAFRQRRLEPVPGRAFPAPPVRRVRTAPRPRMPPGVSPADQDVVRRKLARIVTSLARIRAVRERSLAEYSADELFQAAMERNFELLVGAAVDCNAHLLVRSGHPPPAD